MADRPTTGPQASSNPQTRPLLPSLPQAITVWDTPLLETHILRASGPIPTTGAAVRIRWLHFLRHEQKFANLPALQAQIAEDAQAAAVIHGLAGGR